MFKSGIVLCKKINISENLYFKINHCNDKRFRCRPYGFYSSFQRKCFSELHKGTIQNKVNVFHTDDTKGTCSTFSFT